MHDRYFQFRQNFHLIFINMHAMRSYGFVIQEVKIIQAIDYSFAVMQLIEFFIGSCFGYMDMNTAI